jgi:hypothetical protein
MGDLVGKKQIKQMLHFNGGYLEISSLTEKILTTIKDLPCEGVELSKILGDVERIKEIAENNFKTPYDDINPITHSTHLTDIRQSDPNNSMKDYERQFIPSPSRIKFNKSDSLENNFF